MYIYICTSSRSLEQQIGTKNGDPQIRDHRPGFRIAGDRQSRKNASCMYMCMNIGTSCKSSAPAPNACCYNGPKIAWAGSSR